MHISQDTPSSEEVEITKGGGLGTFVYLRDGRRVYRPERVRLARFQSPTRSRDRTGRVEKVWAREGGGRSFRENLSKMQEVAATATEHMRDL